MGYDCTLHVIDEQAIRSVFVPKLLGKSEAPTALDEKMTQAPKLWKQVREALEGDDAEQAARLVCQLAVTFSACSLPFHYERGFALSLWSTLGDESEREFPEKFCEDPSVLLEDVTAAYPALKGHYPLGIDGNYCTGFYIPAARIPAAVAWVRKTVDAIPKGRRKMFRGLLAVLETAEQRKLAYWEAADLTVPMAGSVGGDPELMTAGYLGNTDSHTADASIQRFRFPLEISGLKGRMSNDLVFWTMTPDRNRVIVNVESWPPSTQIETKYRMSWASRSSRGRWIFQGSKNPILLSEGPPQSSPANPIRLSDVNLDAAKVEWLGGGFVGERAILFPKYARTPLGEPDRRFNRPWIETSARSLNFVPAEGFTELPQQFDAIHQPYFAQAAGVVQRADGVVVTVWVDGYVEQNGRFDKVYVMNQRGSINDIAVGDVVPYGSDGLMYLSDRHLFSIRTGENPVAHCPRFTNIMELIPGPDGAVVLKEGDNDRGDVGKIYFPETREMICLEPEGVGAEMDDVYALHWTANGLNLFKKKEILHIPAETVLSWPRRNADTGRAKSQQELRIKSASPKKPLRKPKN